MRPVDQCVIDPHNGDCFAACVASILDLSLDEVPNFMEQPGDHWFTVALAWLNDRGLTVEVKRGKEGCAVVCTPPGYWIGSGKSPRGDYHHAVVFRGDTMAYDPHPNREGLDGPPLFSYVIVTAEDKEK